MGAVLTISAAGSETSDSAVLTNDKTGLKRGLGMDLMRPKFTVINPELIYTLPKLQILCSIVDNMMHTLDRHFTLTEGNDLTDEVAEALMRTVINNGKADVANSSDYQAISKLMWCGSISHNGLNALWR